MTHKEWPRAVYNEVLYGVQEVLTYATGFEPQDTNPDTNFRNDLNLEMVQILQVKVFCEARFKVHIPESQLATLNTINDVVQCILDQQVEVTAG